MSGGTGSRMNAGIPKQFMKTGEKSLLEISLSKFQEHSGIDVIFIVSHADQVRRTKELVDNKNFSKVEKIIAGGDTRQRSVSIGVNTSEEDHENILIHDSARPFVSTEIIDRVLLTLKNSDAVTPVIDSPDTLVSINSDGFLNKYLDRESIKRVQTPQGFKRNIIVDAHYRAEKDPDRVFTDDCSMIIHYGLSDVKLVEGDPENTKITYREDIERFNLKK